MRERIRVLPGSRRQVLPVGPSHEHAEYPAPLPRRRRRAGLVRRFAGSISPLSAVRRAVSKLLRFRRFPIPCVEEFLFRQRDHLEKELELNAVRQHHLGRRTDRNTELWWWWFGTLKVGRRSPGIKEWLELWREICSTSFQRAGLTARDDLQRIEHRAWDRQDQVSCWPCALQRKGDALYDVTERMPVRPMERALTRLMAQRKLEDRLAMILPTKPAKSPNGARDRSIPTRPCLSNRLAPVPITALGASFGKFARISSQTEARCTK